MYEKELMKLQQSLSESENSAKSAERDAEKWRHEAKTIRVELENKLELLQHELIALRNKNAENEFNVSILILFIFFTLLLSFSKF